jgi:hypothetical protein
MDNFRLLSLKKIEGNIISENTDLSICLGANGFIFSLIDNNNYTLKAIGEFACELCSSITTVMSALRGSLSSIDIRLFNFANIRVIAQTTKDVFVPVKLFDNTKVRDYLQNCALLNGSDTILEAISERLDTINVFAMPMFQHSGVKILMPKAEFMPCQKILAEYVFDTSKLANNTAILYRNEKGADIVVFKGTQFTLSNSFVYDNSEDLIYNVLFAFNNLNIDTEDVNLLITGQKYSVEEQQLLSRYIKNVAYANPMESLRVGIEFDGIDLQRYFLVLSR